jgi:hypothetical protein
MKLGQLKSLILIITFSVLVFSDTYSQDLLDTVKSNSKLVIELKDAYRAFHINNIIKDQNEMTVVFLDDRSDAEMKTLLDGFINVCDSLKNVHLKNDTLNAYVSQYLIATIQIYNIAQSKGFSSLVFNKYLKKYNRMKGEYMNYLFSTYSTNHFVSMTEEKYWQTNDKNNYIKSPDYASYKSLKETNLKEALIVLEKLTKQTTDFQEYSIYQIELADQYVKHSDSLGDNAYETAIEKYKSILDQKKYSIYLFEAWLKWRLVNQQHIYGISQLDDIPNNLYDKMREEVAVTILDYITKNDKDETAINEFLLIATHPIVRRFGAYRYGNQNILEYLETFGED